MLLEQAVYASARTVRMSGYQLIARSPGISEELAVRLDQWGPTHGSLDGDDGDAWALSYFPIGQHWSVLARTCYGGPEYSERGGRQVVTRFLVLTTPQSSRYQHHPLRVFHTASTLGHLRLLPQTSERLPIVELPDEVPYCVQRLLPENGHSPELLQHAFRQVSLGRSVALIGVPHPLAALNYLFDRLPDDQRRELSFSLGLKVTVRRPARVYLLSRANPALRAQLNLMGIECVSATPAVDPCTPVQLSTAR